MNIREVSERFHIPADTLRYYEKVGAIPPVTRTAGGVRDYGEKDLGWVELAKCMRAAGLPIDVLIEYRRLYELGDETISDRLRLLREQRESLLEQRESIDRMLGKLDFKIARYEAAEKSGSMNREE